MKKMPNANICCLLDTFYPINKYCTVDYGVYDGFTLEYQFPIFKTLKLSFVTYNIKII